MKKSDLGQTIGVLANIGVIAGIVFLAVEIRNSAMQAEAAARQEMVGQVTSWYDQIASDQGISEVYEFGLKDFNALSSPQQTRFDALMRSLLHTAYSGIQARNALFSNEELAFEERAIEGLLVMHLDQPGFRQWWLSTDRRGLPRGLLELIDDIERSSQ